MNKGKGIVYKLYNEGGVYYGSTITSLSQRLAQHKSQKCSSRILFDPKFSNPKIELIEEFYYDDIKELRDREAYYIENLECVNKRIPNRTKKETQKAYYDNNKDKILQNKKKIRKKNKDKIGQYNKKYYEENKETMKKISFCECGGKYTHVNKARHCRSKKHQKYLTTIV